MIFKCERWEARKQILGFKPAYDGSNDQYDWYLNSYLCFLHYSVSWKRPNWSSDMDLRCMYYCKFMCENQVWVVSATLGNSGNVWSISLESHTFIEMLVCCLKNVMHVPQSAAENRSQSNSEYYDIGVCKGCWAWTCCHGNTDCYHREKCFSWVLFANKPSNPPVCPPVCPPCSTGVSGCAGTAWCTWRPSSCGARWKCGWRCLWWASSAPQLPGRCWWTEDRSWSNCDPPHGTWETDTCTDRHVREGKVYRGVQVYRFEVCLYLCQAGSHRGPSEKRCRYWSHWASRWNMSGRTRGMLTQCSHPTWSLWTPVRV